MTKCTRCQGLMVEDHYLDFEGTYGHMWAKAHRCMNCGSVHDSVIEQHRLAKPQPALVLANGKLHDEADDCDEDAQPVVLRAA
ncbi:hypothetical protein [Candidatus Nitrospira nitrificans]|uniref:Uncharacterized protein n=1 Tax=Candidatus Nitrospira nitrificans TaxID=1742973 RepID=A0A0S4LMA7_9BACT|nr:hypothetical protein [Candidatus Nitrospira nitrificans]CUS36226.1 hypothetical protein COMA2_210027 [Candidatus Nitrospira nitrificans]